MAEQNNAVLVEQIRQLRKDLIAHRTETKEEFRERDEQFSFYKREMRQEMKEMEHGIDKAQSVANEVNTSMRYITDTVGKLDGMVNGFIQMITTQNSQIDSKISEQNKKIDEFINSDKRMDSKKKLIVSILQVFAGILATLLTFWASGAI